MRNIAYIFTKQFNSTYIYSIVHIYIFITQDPINFLAPIGAREVGILGLRHSINQPFRPCVHDFIPIKQITLELNCIFAL